MFRPLNVNKMWGCTIMFENLDDFCLVWKHKTVPCMLMHLRAHTLSFSVYITVYVDVAVCMHDAKHSELCFLEDLICCWSVEVL
jgi:hypothetical protein